MLGKLGVSTVSIEKSSKSISKVSARFNVQKEMFKNIDAAQTLGTNPNDLRKEFEDRQLTTKTFNNL